MPSRTWLEVLKEDQYSQLSCHHLSHEQLSIANNRSEPCRTGVKMTSDTDGIKKTLNAYRDNLVASNVEGCVNLYASDGVLMAPGYETQVGHDAVKQWYANIRKLVTLDVEFDIHEAVAITEEYGFARTSSVGTLKINATGVTRKEANQELFVMKKVEGEWKIARYCFSESKLPE
ncbi:hypothetical protein LTR33_005588 [Friedmanniomyces endolithicus]|nr:hypothetical protein LTR33_005588 [Friedmanniomyces endolithicus]